MSATAERIDQAVTTIPASEPEGSVISEPFAGPLIVAEPALRWSASFEAAPEGAASGVLEAEVAPLATSDRGSELVSSSFEVEPETVHRALDPTAPDALTATLDAAPAYGPEPRDTASGAFAAQISVAEAPPLTPVGFEALPDSMPPAFEAVAVVDHRAVSPTPRTSRLNRKKTLGRRRSSKRTMPAAQDTATRLATPARLEHDVPPGTPTEESARRGEFVARDPGSDRYWDPRGQHGHRIDVSADGGERRGHQPGGYWDRSHIHRGR